jgi:hypothetical protein
MHEEKRRPPTNMKKKTKMDSNVSGGIGPEVICHPAILEEPCFPVGLTPMAI